MQQEVHKAYTVYDIESRTFTEDRQGKFGALGERERESMLISSMILGESTK